MLSNALVSKIIMLPVFFQTRSEYADLLWHGRCRQAAEGSRSEN